MSWALRVSVPLNRRCSRKCDAPATRSSSWRDPAPTQKPTVTERTSGIRSVTRVRPLPRRLSAMVKGLPAPTGTAVATPVAAAAATSTAGGLGRAEIAELTAQLALEAVLEGHHVVRRRARRRRRARLPRLPPRCAVAFRGAVARRLRRVPGEAEA